MLFRNKMNITLQEQEHSMECKNIHAYQILHVHLFTIVY